MKKKWVLFITIIFCFTFIFLSTGERSIKKDTNKENIDLRSREENYIPELVLLNEGEMDGIEFGIGTKSEEIIAQWGEPEEYSNDFMGGALLKYNDIYFFINDEKVTGIYYTGDEEIYGVEIGMDLEQIEETLGNPNDSYNALYSELYLNEPLILKYTADKYIANFEINTETNKLNSIFILQDFAK